MAFTRPSMSPDDASPQDLRQQEAEIVRHHDEAILHRQQLFASETESTAMSTGDTLTGGMVLTSHSELQEGRMRKTRRVTPVQGSIDDVAPLETGWNMRGATTASSVAATVPPPTGGAAAASSVGATVPPPTADATTASIVGATVPPLTGGVTGLTSSLRTDVSRESFAATGSAFSVLQPRAMGDVTEALFLTRVAMGLTAVSSLQTQVGHHVAPVLHGGAILPGPHYHNPPQSHHVPPAPRPLYCKCKKGRCLKLYCQCVSASTTCGPKCHCEACLNTTAFGLAAPVPHAALLTGPHYHNPPPSHHVPPAPRPLYCKCRKNRCLKLYCQCFSASMTCGPKCRCEDCLNTTAQGKDIESSRKTILLRNPRAFEEGNKSLRKRLYSAMRGKDEFGANGGLHDPKRTHFQSQIVEQQQTTSANGGAYCDQETEEDQGPIFKPDLKDFRFGKGNGVPFGHARRSFVKKYQMARDEKEIDKILGDAVNHVHEKGGRFLMPCLVDGKDAWRVATEAEARQMCRAALLSRVQLADKQEKSRVQRAGEPVGDAVLASVRPGPGTGAQVVHYSNTDEFLMILHCLLKDHPEVASWSDDGKSFFIHDEARFVVLTGREKYEDKLFSCAFRKDRKIGGGWYHDAFSRDRMPPRLGSSKEWAAIVRGSREERANARALDNEKNAIPVMSRFLAKMLFSAKENVKVRRSMLKTKEAWSLAPALPPSRPSDSRSASPFYYTNGWSDNPYDEFSVANFGPKIEARMLEISRSGDSI